MELNIPKGVNAQQCRRCAKEAREVCSAHEQADDKADAVLLGVYSHSALTRVMIR